MPAPRQPDSLRSKILDWDVYLQGQSFKRRNVVDAFGYPPNAVSDVLSKMAVAGELVRESDQCYCRPQRHWIHGMRLAQSVG